LGLGRAGLATRRRRGRPPHKRLAGVAFRCISSPFVAFAEIKWSDWVRSVFWFGFDRARRIFSGAGFYLILFNIPLQYIALVK
jgi:hypothetical protein